MNHRGTQTASRRRWILAGAAALIAGAAGALFWYAAPPSASNGAGAWSTGSAAPSAGPWLVAATGPASTQAAASAPTTGPATQPPVRWLPPRFADRREDRERMVATIRDEYGLSDRAILAAMRAVPRHEFVPASLSRQAYDDTPLPIGHGQTISQPFIVAEMTRQLNLRSDAKVLEIGTGSGYQAAVLTEFTTRVYSIEIVQPLAEAAARRLQRLGYTPVQVRTGDGYYGWPEEAPFDGIIVTCAAGQIPPPLVEQLAPGGRMVIPVGGSFAMQSLMLVEKDSAGTVRSRSLMAVRFVPLIRAEGRKP